MLIFTRRGGEAVHIGDHVRLLVDSVEDGRVRIGIDAPSEIRILRGELRATCEPDAIKGSQVSPQSKGKPVGGD